MQYGGAPSPYQQGPPQGVAPPHPGQPPRPVGPGQPPQNFPQQYPGQMAHGPPQHQYPAAPGQYPAAPGQYGAPGGGGPPQAFQQAWYSSYYQQMTPAEKREATQWFQAIDRDRSGEITANEIAQCTFANQPLGWDTAAKLVRVFDKDMTGSIDIFEYSCMHKFLSLMQHAFFSADRDRSGRLDANEIHQAIGVGQMQVPMPVVQVLYNKYNRDGFGVGFGDFLQLVSHIASAKSAFAWEDQAQGGRGAVTIDAFKFIEMSGRC